MSEESIKTTESIYHCARCGNDHEKLEFNHFNGKPIVDEDGTTWDWWSFCPITGDPVLMRIIPDDTGVTND